MNQTNNRIREEWRKHIYSYEQDDSFNLLSACRAKYGDVAIEDFLESAEDFMLSKIDELLKSQKESLVEKIERYDNERIARYMKDKSKKSENEVMIDILSIIKEDK